MSEFSNEKYRITTISFGCLMISSGVLLGVFSIIADLIIVSCLLSLGTSCFVHALMGGIEKDELTMGAEGQRKSKVLEAVLMLVGNIKITGPVVTFIALWSMFYGGGILQKNLELKTRGNVDSVLKNVEIETKEGLIVASDNTVSNRLDLVYKNGSSGNIKRPKNIASNGKSIREMLSENQLDINLVESIEDKSDKFIIKKLDYGLGSIKRESIKNILEDLAEKTSEGNGDELPSGNTLTKTILSDCVDIEGVCKVPEHYKVEVYFDKNLSRNEAKICREHSAFLMYRIKQEQFILREENKSIKNGEFPIVINKLIKGDCLNNYNKIKVAMTYKTQLFPNGSNFKLAHLSYDPLHD